MNDKERRYRDSRQVTLIGAVVNLLLAAVKIVGGVLGSSQALVADGVHSFSDLATDALVLFAARHGGRDADSEHPYGHARIETAAAVGMGILLILVALGILIDAVQRLFEPARLLQPGWPALWIAAVSILAKEGLYQYTALVARRIDSALLRANAWHHRSDALSSIVVLVGVAGSMAGLHYLDAIGAALVAIMIGHVGWEVGWNAIRELIDTGLQEERLEAIRTSIRGVTGVKGFHLLRTRTMGHEALADVHIILSDPRLSVSEGHQISETVRRSVIRDVAEVTDVTVHIDPEDDERTAPCSSLPLGETIRKELSRAWSELEAGRAVQRVTLHYIAGKVHVDVVLPLRFSTGHDDARRIEHFLQEAASGLSYLGSVRVFFSPGEETLNG